MDFAPADAILSRIYDTVEADGTTGTTTIRFWKPYLDANAEGDAPWRCPYQLSGSVGSGKILQSAGRDSFEALLTALMLAAVRIRSFNQAGVRITLFGEDDLGFGFLNLPDPDTPRDPNVDDTRFKEAFDKFFREFTEKHKSKNTK